MDQAVDRHHQNVVLDSLDAPRTDEAHDAKGAPACPASPASSEPRRLVVQKGEVTPLVGHRFRLDYNGNPVWGDRHRIDVSSALPAQRVPKPPAVRLKRGERALHLVLRAGAYSTTAGERKPVPSVESQADGG